MDVSVVHNDLPLVRGLHVVKVCADTEIVHNAVTASTEEMVLGFMVEGEEKRREDVGGEQLLE